MKASSISTFSINYALRSSTASMQNRLPALQQELATGRNADNGLVLGHRTTSLSTFKNDITHLEGFVSNNERLLSRLSMAQSGMEVIAEATTGFTTTLGLAIGDETQRAAVIESARITVENTVATLNLKADGIYIYGGENTDQQPLEAYAGSPLQTEFQNRFNAYFGFPVSDPAAAGIDSAQIDDFLTNVAEPLFMGADWTSVASTASDSGPLSRLDENQTINATVTANEDAFRKLMMSAVVTQELYSSAISGEALESVAYYALSQASSGQNELTSLRGAVGLSEERVSRANENLENRLTIIEGYAGELEGVDTYEVSVEINSLLTQIEVSYAVTSRIQQLSLLRFLP